jgi:hypothetical protein
MPRLSSEAISASLWRAEPIPQPPSYLKGDARKIYLEIVSHYPSDRFPPGAIHLLETFAVTSAVLRQVMRRMQVVDLHDPESRRLTGQMVKLSGVQLSCATKLRLTPSSHYRTEDGRLTEKRSPRSRLLGGTAVN